jgi:adenylosuccinate synthase
MVKKANVVIGSSYGDEGKGLMTDYFAAQGDRSLVIRFNGGCQAGHTVMAPDGRRHVFAHFGAGTFAGAATYLSQHFAVNPVLYRKERAKLMPLLGAAPKILVDERAPVTTFFDMLVNQLVEEQRGSKRHGSCGMGYGETIGRHEDKTFSLVAKDLLDVHGLRLKLEKIRDSHLPQRCWDLGVTSFGQHHALCTTDVLVDAFIEAAQEFLADVVLVRTAASAFDGFDNLVFEGAQGLLLDQDRGSFPHVTRSNTGILNALDVAREAGVGELAVTYATRAYLTRHGAGPLAHEIAGLPYPGVVDMTNQPNPYQGTLRFAYLDHDRLAQSIRTDLHDAVGSGITVTAKLSVSCLDQVGDTAMYWSGGTLQRTSAEEQVRALADNVLDVGFCSYGPTRKTIQAPEKAAIVG